MYSGVQTLSISALICKVFLLPSCRLWPYGNKMLTFREKWRLGREERTCWRVVKLNRRSMARWVSSIIEMYLKHMDGHISFCSDRPLAVNMCKSDFTMGFISLHSCANAACGTEMLNFYILLLDPKYISICPEKKTSPHKHTNAFNTKPQTKNVHSKM